MKKNYALLASALMLSLAGFSQEKVVKNEFEAALSFDESVQRKGTAQHMKAYGDTMAYFDFNGGLPAGWTVFENANTGFNWTWSQSAPRGQFTTAPAIASTTGSNGFMMLESDYYNTPIPGTGAVGMDAYFQSGPIAIQNIGSVLIRFQQSFRYCCRGTFPLEVQVKSNTNPNWKPYNVKNGISVNNATPNPMHTEINISDAAANSDTIWFRFYQGQASHYYWMVDDIAIVEGPNYDIDLQDFRVSFQGNGNVRKQFYTQIPMEMFDTMWVSGTISNQGGLVDSGQVAYEITQDLNCFGQPGVGSYAYVHEPLPTMNPMDTIEVDFNNPFLPPAKGQYTLSVFGTSSSVDQVGSNNIKSASFSVVDSVYAKDDGTAETTIGPHSYVGFDHDGSSLYLYFEMPKPQVATSLSFFPAGSRSVGASFTPVLYGIDTTGNCNIYSSSFDLTAACFSPAPVAQYPFPILIDSNNVNTWVTVNIPPTNLNQYPAYAIGYEATGYVHGGTNNNVTVGASVGEDMDATHGAFNGIGSYDMNAMICKSQKSDCGTAGGNPMMRINFGQLSDTCMLVGIEEEAVRNTEFGISPNPNNGQFNLKISTEMAKDYSLTITNMIGQNVYSEQISVNNEELNKNMNFTHLKKGIYFVTLQNATERQTQKIVIR